MERTGLFATLICVRRHGYRLARQMVDAGQECLVVAKAPSFGRDWTAMQAPALEPTPRYPWQDLTSEPEGCRAQRCTDCCRNIAASQHQPADLTAHPRCCGDLSQPRGDDVRSSRTRGQPQSGQDRRSPRGEVRGDLRTVLSTLIAGSSIRLCGGRTIGTPDTRSTSICRAVASCRLPATIRIGPEWCAAGRCGRAL